MKLKVKGFVVGKFTEWNPFSGASDVPLKEVVEYVPAKVNSLKEGEQVRTRRTWTEKAIEVLPVVVVFVTPIVILVGLLIVALLI